MKWLLLVFAVLLPLRAALGVASAPVHGQPRQLASIAIAPMFVARSEAGRDASAEAQGCFAPDCDLVPLGTLAFGAAAQAQPRWQSAPAVPKFTFIWVPPERPPRLS